jgi:ribose 5-phosphate isomerase B
MPEEILIAADHAGFELKDRIHQELQRLGFGVKDLGTASAESTDYADYAHPLARDISEGKHKRGVLLCGTGLGMSYVANRYPGVRAAVTWSPEVAALARSHNDANVLVLPARMVTEPDAVDILHKWLNTPFDGGRHERRVQKIETSVPETVKEAAKKVVKKAKAAVKKVKTKATAKKKGRRK